MIRLELQSSGPFNILNGSLVAFLLKWEVPFTNLHISQECFSPPPHPPPHPHTHTHGLDLPSASTLGNTAWERWFLRLLSFLKLIIATFVKTALWVTSEVSKRFDSTKIFFEILENWKINPIKSYFVLFFSGILSIQQGVSRKTSCL